MSRDAGRVLRVLGTIALLAVLFGGVRVLFWASEMGGPPSSSPGVFVFRTQAFNFGAIFGIILVVIGIIILATLVIVNVSWLLRARHSVLWGINWKEFTFAAGFRSLGLGFLLGLLLLGLGGFSVYTIPLTEQIIVDSPKRLIIVDRNYLIRGWQPRHVAFDEIAYITYDYTEGSPGAGGQGGSYPPSGKVVITKRDGTKFQVSEDGPKPQRELAATIARATGKSLRQE